nr:polysaccharide deacetylase family protein [Sneathiella litorea]
MDTKTVLITFDDGYADNLEIAAPILKKYGFTAVVFLVSEMIGRNNSVWPMGDPPELGQLMNEKAIRQWLAEGHEIGSHTCSHPDLTTLGNKELTRELEASRDMIEKTFNISCKSLAYPGGDVNERVAAAAEKTGYSLGFSTRSGANWKDTSKLRLMRTEVSASDHHALFCLKLKGVYDWLGFRDTVKYRNTMRRINSLFARHGQAKDSTAT